MRKEFAVKPIALPQPVFIIGTYDKDGTPNAMNAAWGCHNEMDQMMFALAKGIRRLRIFGDESLYCQHGNSGAACCL